MDRPQNKGQPPCPSIVSLEKKPCLTLKSITYTVDCNISTGFFTIDAEFVNNGKKGKSYLFVSPMNEHGTVTNCSITIGGRIVETMVIPEGDAGTMKKSSADENAAQVSESFLPSVFRLPISNLKKKDVVRVRLTYFETLSFHQGRYSLRFPLAIPKEMLQKGETAESVTNVYVNINAGTPNVRWGCSSHAMDVQSQEEGRISLSLNKRNAFASPEFEMNYFIDTNQILCNWIVEPAGVDPADPRGSFALFLSPPQAGSIQSYFGRDIVFLLDHSGSMGGQPMEDAKRAVSASLDALKPNDRFTIIAFDHERVMFSPSPVPADPNSIRAAKSWVASVQACGGTDILSPLSHAVALLQSSNHGVPFVFLITDGAVSNEREICHHIQRNAGNVRVCTFGIGTYCNTYFLKMLAQLGRGFNDVALTPEAIYPSMISLIQKAETPVLTDIEVGLPQGNSVELYPFPIPDLFCGAPLMVSGKFTGQLPPQMSVRGRMPDGNFFTFAAVPQSTQFIPVSRVFAKQRLDLMVANAWLTDSEEMKQQAIALSCSTNLVCPHTTMVAYETTPAKKAAEDRKASRGSGMSPAAKVAVVAGLAVGGILILGAATGAFGDVAGTLGNVSALSGLASGISMPGLDLDFGNMFGDIDVGGCDMCGGLFDSCGGCDMCSGLFDSCGGCDMCSGLFDSCGDMCGGVCSSLGDTCGSLCGGCADTCGGLISGCGDTCSSLCGACNIGDMCGAIGDCAGSVCGSCGDLISGCNVNDMLGSCYDIVKGVLGCLF